MLSGLNLFFFPILPSFTFYFVEEIGSPFLEITMLEYGDLFLFSNFVEIVHVELPNKGWELAMLKIFGQNLFRKFLLVFHNEAVALVSPFHNICNSFVLDYDDELLIEFYMSSWWNLIFPIFYGISFWLVVEKLLNSHCHSKLVILTNYFLVSLIALIDLISPPPANYHSRCITPGCSIAPPILCYFYRIQTFNYYESGFYILKYVKYIIWVE